MTDLGSGLAGRVAAICCLSWEGTGVGLAGLEPATSSLSGNLDRRLCFRIVAMTCGDWSAHVRWCVPSSAVIVTQLVTHYHRLSRPSKQCQPLIDSAQARRRLRTWLFDAAILLSTAIRKSGWVVWFSPGWRPPVF